MAKVFISSTSKDLKDHRQRVMDALRRLEQDGRGMEFFGADAGTPVEVCRREVRDADVVVLIVAHRYGWVPSEEQGGDGARSITEIEYDTAVEAGKDVLTFLVDPEAPWTEGREQDDLLGAQTDEAALAVARYVQRLKAFKHRLESAKVRDTFTTPPSLAEKVSVSMFNWLTQHHAQQQKAELEREEIEGLLRRTREEVRQGNADLAYARLTKELEGLQGASAAQLADERLRLAVKTLGSASLADPRLGVAAQYALNLPGSQERVLALGTLGKHRGMLARNLWRKGECARAIETANEARRFLTQAIEGDSINPDYWGSLGGHLKRMAEWADDPDLSRELEDAMLEAYENGWKHVPDCYPLLNFIEQRARIEARRKVDTHKEVELIGAKEDELRNALKIALKQRQNQARDRQDTPWAAFDIARGRHYLRPNVVQFLDDLRIGLRDACLVARETDDRWMVTTTIDSLRTIAESGVKLDGLAEGIALLQGAVEDEYWYDANWETQPPEAYLTRELAQLREATEQLARADRQKVAADSANWERLLSFVDATELRWSKDDEAEFQVYVEKWKRSLEPTELKILRGLWKIFGAKTVELVTGPIPVDWTAAAEFAKEHLG